MQILSLLDDLSSLPGQLEGAKLMRQAQLLLDRMVLPGAVGSGHAARHQPKGLQIKRNGSMIGNRIIALAFQSMT